MKPANMSEHLSRISTQWTLVFQAHTEGDDVPHAQRQMLERYSGAVYRYLLGAVRDPEAALELSQEFALRFLRGAFRRADPERGRFRDYLRTSLIHLINDYWRSRRAAPVAISQEPAVLPEQQEPSDEDFVASWRAGLLDRAWKALADDNPAYHAVLFLRVEQPALSSGEMAEELSRRLQRPVNDAWVRKTAQRAQAKFAHLLIAEVELSLESASLAEIEQELHALDLLRYCRSALKHRQEKQHDMKS